MDPIAGTDAKRKRRREFSESDSGDEYLYRLKRFYTSQIRHVEKVLPTVSKKGLYNILIIIKKYYEHVVKSIDSMLELSMKMNEIRVRCKGFELELNEQFTRYRRQFFDLEKNILIWRNPIVPLVKNIRKDETIIEFFLNAPPHLEGLLPSLTEKWLKDMILDIRNNLRELFEPKVYKKPKATQILENKYKINEFITLKLENERTQIYVNGKRFLQCMRLFLQIPPQTRHLYEEIESIDEAGEIYKQSLWENRIVEGPMAIPRPSRNIKITPEQEFWGHCSNLQAWVEHDYDTRLLMSNMAFPLLKKLTEAGDPLARKVFKEEIAQRLESGYPSVVQYLIIQGYISHFTPFEFKIMIDTTNLIKNVSSQPKMLSDFLQTCANRFPTILGDILLKILELSEGKENLITASSRKSWILGFRVPLGSNPPFLDKIKDALMDKLNKVGKEKKREILDYIQVIDNNKNFDVEILKGYHQEGDKLLSKIFKNKKRIRKFKGKLVELGKRYKKGENESDLHREANRVKTLLYLKRIQNRKATLEFKTISEDILIHESNREYWEEWNSHNRCQKNLKPSCEECLDAEKCKRDYKYTMLEYQLKRKRKGEISLEFDTWFEQELEKIDLDSIPPEYFKLIGYKSHKKKKFYEKKHSIDSSIN